jgi:hypothetical protein
MEEIVSIILEYASIWMPSLTAILGIVTTILLALSKIKTAIEDLKKTDVLQTLSEDLKKALNDNEALKQQNENIREQYDILIDEITKIKNYRESKKK